MLSIITAAEFGEGHYAKDVVLSNASAVCVREGEVRGREERGEVRAREERGEKEERIWR